MKTNCKNLITDLGGEIPLPPVMTNSRYYPTTHSSVQFFGKLQGLKGDVINCLLQDRRGKPLCSVLLVEE